ncbi:hypothetical protein FOZ62_009713, partial [Perkinsus olseni]
MRSSIFQFVTHEHSSVTRYIDSTGEQDLLFTITDMGLSHPPRCELSVSWHPRRSSDRFHIVVKRPPITLGKYDWRIELRGLNFAKVQKHQEMASMGPSYGTGGSTARNGFCVVEVSTAYLKPQPQLWVFLRLKAVTTVNLSVCSLEPASSVKLSQVDSYLNDYPEISQERKCHVASYKLLKVFLFGSPITPAVEFIGKLFVPALVQQQPQAPTSGQLGGEGES